MSADLLWERHRKSNAWALWTGQKAQSAIVRATIHRVARSVTDSKKYDWVLRIYDERSRAVTTRMTFSSATPVSEVKRAAEMLVLFGDAA